MLTASQFLRSILLGKSSIGGDPTSRRPTKAALWGLSATTPGMIALAATIVRTISLSYWILFFNYFSYHRLLSSAAQTHTSLPKEGPSLASTGPIASPSINI